jgi:hypothetical protein
MFFNCLLSDFVFVDFYFFEYETRIAQLRIRLVVASRGNDKTRRKLTEMTTRSG